MIKKLLIYELVDKTTTSTGRTSNFKKELNVAFHGGVA
jgi:hypothetical protein